MNDNSVVACESRSLQLNTALLMPVYVGREANTGSQFLMRKADLPVNTGLPAAIIKEAYYLKTLHSPHTPHLLDIVLSPCSVFFLTSHCGEPLPSFYLSLTPLLTAKISYSLLEALEFLESRSIVHLALEPECILVTEDGTARIEGFYWAMRAEREQRNRSSDYHFNAYTSPELLNPCTQPSSNNDMWSFALIFLTLLRRKSFLPVYTKAQLLAFFSSLVNQGESQASIEKLRDLVPSITPLERDLLTKLINLDPASRISASQAKAHPYFNTIRNAEFASQVED